MKYNFEYSDNKYNFLRLIILSILLLVDLVNFVSFISGFFTSIYITLASLLIFVILLVIRIFTTFLTKKYCLNYANGELIVSKKFPMTKKCIVSINKNDIKTINNVDNNDIVDVSCYSKDALCKPYIITLESNKKYLIHLPNILYAMLTCEEKYDLFR